MRRRVMRMLTTVAMVGAVAGGTSGVAATAGPVLWHRPIVVVGANQSNNWSGYNQGTLEQGGKMFNGITGTWTVPTASQHTAGEAEYSSSWIGIGGGCVDAGCTVTDSTLIQAGTEQDVATDGTDSYSAWYELIPAPSITIDTLAIHAGDKMFVSISEDTPGSNVWIIIVRDRTQHQSFTTTVPYSSTHATAEWIEETPVVIDDGGNVTIGPLPDLSPVRFNKGTTNGAPAGLVKSEEMQLVDTDGTPLATPSKPDPTKDGFRDCTFASHCKAPKSGYVDSRRRGARHSLPSHPRAGPGDPLALAGGPRTHTGAGEPDQFTTRTEVACGPLSPWATSNSTFWFSSRLR